NQIDESFDEVAVAPAALDVAAQNLHRSVRLHRILISARHGDRLVHVDEPDNLRHYWDLIANETIGISRTIQALVMPPHDRTNLLQRTQIAAERIAHHGVRFDELVLLGFEPAFLPQD